MGSNYDVQTLTSIGVTVDRLEVSKSGEITGMFLPNAEKLTPVTDLFDITQNETKTRLKLKKTVKERLKKFHPCLDCDIFEQSLNPDITDFKRQFYVNSLDADILTQDDSANRESEISVEEKFISLELILPVHKTTLKKRQDYNLNVQTGNGPNLKAFSECLSVNQFRKKHTVEMYTRHVSCLMCYVQQKLAVNVDPSVPPDDIDVDKILLKSFDTAVRPGC